jgi:hypothetical protein
MPLNAAERSARYRAKDVDAYRERKREYAKTPEQKAKRTEYMRKYREENREKMNEQARVSHSGSYARRSKEARHAQHIWYTYRLTREDYLAMLEAQGGKCLICGIDRPRGNKSWHVDHDHATGKVRGLLCNYCNPRLGWYESHKEDIERYLKNCESNKP